MRFKTFLNESNVSSAYKPISMEEVYTLAHTRFSEAFSEKYPYIVRGMNRKNGVNELLVSGIKGRVSANTSNEYTILVDHHPGWKDYPKRSESLICTTMGNLEYAYDFGDPFIILPENGAKIGVCSDFDFWESFPLFKRLCNDSKIAEYSVGLNIFNDILRGLMHVADIKLDEHNTNYERLVGALNQIMDYISNKNSPHVSAEEKKFFATVISGKESMLEFCNRILDPKVNGFKLTDYKGIKSVASQKREVWVSAPSLAIAVPDNNDAGIDELEKHFNKIKSSI